MKNSNALIVKSTKNNNKNINKAAKKKNKKKKAMMNNLDYSSFTPISMSSGPYLDRSLVNSVLMNKRQRAMEYLLGLLEPEITVTNMLTIKQPSIVPIPSTTVCFRNNMNIGTDANGDFALAWNPNYLMTDDVVQLSNYIVGGVAGAFDTYSHVCIKNTTTTSLDFIPSYIPHIDLSKYRLVSAKLKITYIGSVLNKSGMLYACASYDKTPVAIGRKLNTTIVPVRSPQNAAGNIIPYNNLPLSWKNTYLALNEQTISNGLWNKNCNITEANQGISCLHIPTDPVSETFFPIGSYFGAPIPVASVNTIWTADHESMLDLDPTTNNGSQLCYLVCGHGLPANIECINIQVFYNYEIIPTPMSAPFLRATVNAIPMDIQRAAREVVNISAPSLALRPSSSSLTTNLLNKLTNAGKILSSILATGNTLIGGAKNLLGW